MATQDPTQAAFDESSQVPKVGGNALEGLATSFGAPKGSALDNAIQQHHQARLDEAKMHRRNASTAAGILTYGIDPKTGQSLTDEQRTQYTNEYKAAMAAYEKAAGVNKETKGAIQKARMLVEHMIGQGQKRQQAGQQGQQGAQGGPPPPPAPQSTSAAAPAGPAGGPPPPVPFAEQAPFLRAQVAQQQDEAKTQREDAAKFQDFAKRQEVVKQAKLDEIEAANKAKATGKPKITDISYTGPDGQPHFGKSVTTGLNEDGSPATTYFDQEGNELPPDTSKFSAWMMPRTTTSTGVRMVQQPDGSIKQVPVVTSSTTRRGGPISPPPVPLPSKDGQATAPKAPTAKASPSAAMGGGKVVGGKVPPGVSKAYDSYNNSVTRYQIMEAAVPRALKGDQQAMINLLYNHIGMTTGLQKGARITESLISEAENSAPWEATLLKRIGVDKEFEITPELLRGVVLDSQTMHNMVDLAKERVDQDRQAWQREIQSAKGGYGMTGAPPPPPTGTKDTSGGSFKPF